MAHRQLPEMPAAPVLELHGQRKVFHIPQGLKLILEECTREVLRHQPPNMYTFLADLMEDKLIVREFKSKVIRDEGGGGRKSWQWRRWSWDGSSLLSESELIEFLSEFQISIEMANRLALIIQSAYRGFMGRRKFKGAKGERDTRRQSLWDDWRHAGNMFVSGHDVLEILAYYKISLFEANAFATKIQKVFRGHVYRKYLEETQPELAAHLHSLGITHEVAHTQATKIQTAFRGYKSRQAQKGDGGVEGLAEEGQQELRELDGEEEEEDQNEEEEDAEEMEESEQKPKYEAFFPEGIDASEEEEIEEGATLPPRFTHEHFGEIDPMGLKEKFSTHDFKQKMSQMMKGLEDATEDRRKANLEKVESTRRINEASRRSKGAITLPTSQDTSGTLLDPGRKSGEKSQVSTVLRTPSEL